MFSDLSYILLWDAPICTCVYVYLPIYKPQAVHLDSQWRPWMHQNNFHLNGKQVKHIVYLEFQNITIMKHDVRFVTSGYQLHDRAVNFSMT
jgi:hypothetical protein